MSTPAGYAFALILFFGRGRGRGGRATAKPTVSRRTSADGFAVKMKRTKAGGRVVKSCSPFSAAKWQRQKSRQSRGKSGDFFAEQKNTTRPLTVWIVGTGIVFSGEMCYTYSRQKYEQWNNFRSFRFYRRYKRVFAFLDSYADRWLFLLCQSTNEKI